MQNDQFIFL
jgi:hypothetical protein